ncbi:hypothetical protein G9A89_007912 [Geosiphon pyriformis]|nr:hypothetical protein G9A89_007912 [Geosiphon pyriformis]
MPQNTIFDSEDEAVILKNNYTSGENLTIDSNATEAEVTVSIPRKRTREGYIVFWTAFVFIFLNAIGCSFVLFQTIKKWRARGLHTLPMCYRLPFYTACTDASMIVLLLFNLVYTNIHEHPWPDPACSYLAGALQITMNANFYLYGIIAVTTYLKVAREKEFEFGRYDWKMFAIIIVLDLITLMTKIDGGYGRLNNYWCSTINTTLLSAITSLFLMGTNFGTTLFCFLYILVILAKNRAELKEASVSVHGKTYDDRVTRKILSYVFVFLLQWIPVFTYVVAGLLKIIGTWTYVFIIGGINFGGIGNALAYLMNERLLYKESNKVFTRWSQSTLTQNSHHVKSRLPRIEFNPRMSFGEHSWNPIRSWDSYFEEPAGQQKQAKY